jgi:hypothetical protein
MVRQWCLADPLATSLSSAAPPYMSADDVHRRDTDFARLTCRLRTGIMAGSPCPIEVKKRASS